MPHMLMVTRLHSTVTIHQVHRQPRMLQYHRKPVQRLLKRKNQQLVHQVMTLKYLLVTRLGAGLHSKTVVTKSYLMMVQTHHQQQMFLQSPMFMLIGYRM